MHHRRRRQRRPRVRPLRVRYAAIVVCALLAPFPVPPPPQPPASIPPLLPALHPPRPRLPCRLTSLPPPSGTRGPQSTTARPAPAAVAVRGDGVKETLFRAPAPVGVPHFGGAVWAAVVVGVMGAFTRNRRWASRSSGGARAVWAAVVVGDMWGAR